MVPLPPVAYLNPKNDKPYIWCGTHENHRGRDVVTMQQVFGKGDWKELPESEVRNHWKRVLSDSMPEIAEWWNRHYAPQP